MTSILWVYSRYPWIFPFKLKPKMWHTSNAHFKWFSNDCRVFTRQLVPYLPYRVITTKSIWPESRLKRTKISFRFRSMKTSGQIFVDRWWLKNLPPYAKNISPLVENVEILRFRVWNEKGSNVSIELINFEHYFIDYFDFLREQFNWDWKLEA